MRRKMKAIKREEALAEALTTILLGEGGWVLRERHGFTAEQVLAWGIETSRRAMERMNDGKPVDKQDLYKGITHKSKGKNDTV